MKSKLIKLDPRKLLRNKKVVEEINRHKWLESEIAGYDIGFQAAAEDWLRKYSAVWIAYHDDKKTKSFTKTASLRKKRPAK